MFVTVDRPSSHVKASPSDGMQSAPVPQHLAANQMRWDAQIVVARQP
jgi:hypothetical protein